MIIGLSWTGSLERWLDRMALWIGLCISVLGLCLIGGVGGLAVGTLIRALFLALKGILT